MSIRTTDQKEPILIRLIKLAKFVFTRFSVLVLIFLSLSFVLLDSLNTRITSNIKIFVLDSVSPVLKVMSYGTNYLDNIVTNFVNIVNIADKNEELKKENQLLRTQYFDLKHLRAENEQLKKLLKFIDETKVEYHTARVVGNISGPYLRSGLISTNKNTFVKKGQVVINQQGLVGRIIEVGDKTARILLITDLNSKIPIISVDSRERGIAAGNNSDDLDILYLPEDSKVRVGELIVTSGDGEYFPAGLPIGVIKDIKDKKVTLKPAVDWSRLEYVNIVNY